MPIPERKSATVFPYRGKWRVQYLDLYGKQKVKTVDSRRAGYEYLNQVQNAQANGYLNPTNDQIPNVSEWLETWLAIRSKELKPSTVQGYRINIDKWLVPAFGKIRLDQLSVVHIESLYAELSTNQRLKNSTIARVHALLSGALSMAVRYGYIRQSPLISVRKPKEHPTEIQTFSEAELRAIENEIAQLPIDQQIRWLLAFRYGLRQGECLALRRSDFENREVTVQRTVRNIPGQGLVITEPKSRNATRTIPVDDQLWSLAESIPGNQGFLYGQSEMPVDSSVDRRRFKVLIRKAGVRELPMHAARHTVATSFIKNNVNPRVVQMILGHSSSAYTLATYVHPSGEDIRMAIFGSWRNRIAL